MNKDNLLHETIVLLSADMYSYIEKHLEEKEMTSSWGVIAEEIVSLAERFENELDWQDGDERDYLEELEKFEAKTKEQIKKGELL